MARLYSNQFSLLRDATAGFPGGPDPGDIWIVRQIFVYNGNETSVFLQFRMVDEVSGATLAYFQFVDDTVATFDWQGRLVLQNPQTLAWHSSATEGDAGLDVYIGGYVLTSV